jgi:hypothetical protein
LPLRLSHPKIRNTACRDRFYGHGACKNSVRVSQFRANFKKRFVSGHDFSRAVKAANDEGFSLALATAALFPFQFAFGQRSAAQPASRTLPVQHQ